MHNSTLYNTILYIYIFINQYQFLYKNVIQNLSWPFKNGVFVQIDTRYCYGAKNLQRIGMWLRESQTHPWVSF